MPDTNRAHVTAVSGLEWLGSAALITLISGYRAVVAPLLVGTCRFTPSCSHYAEEAVRRFGPLQGGRLAVKRLLKCHPLGAGGWDPVPENLPR